jgi:CRP-like cAMP-binding protein
MSTDAREVSVELLRSLTPLEGMKRENLHALAKKVTVKQLTAGRTLFKEGDSDKRTIWIIKGLVELSERGRTIGMIEGGSADARAPLNQSVPRKITARAVEDVDYLAIDADLLDVMITWDQTGTYEVSELQAQLENVGSDDWMTTLLQTKAFHRIPPANIQAIFMRMQRVPYKAGELVIKQGDEGDFFYAPDRHSYIQIAQTDNPSSSAIADWEDLAKGKGGDYEQIAIRPTGNQPPVSDDTGKKSADWEFKQGSTHILDRGFVLNGKGYAILLSAPDSDWSKFLDSMQPVFESFTSR